MNDNDFAKVASLVTASEKRMKGALITAVFVLALVIMFVGGWLHF